MNSISNIAKWGRVIGIDFEYRSGPPPEPVCMVAIDFNTGKKWELFFEQNTKVNCPIDFNEEDLVVAHNFSAEASCFGVLNWDLPLTYAVQWLNIEILQTVSSLSIACWKCVMHLKSRVLNLMRKKK